MSKQKQKNKNNYAFIDGQNLYLSITSTGWKLDYVKFRNYLRSKYSVKKAYIFIGKIEGNERVYTYLQNAGFILVFKPVVHFGVGKIKGNVDAEMVLHTMIELNNFDGAVIVSGDGDFRCLVDYLISQKKIKKVISP